MVSKYASSCIRFIVCAEMAGENMCKGSFNNYVDNKKGEGVSRQSMLGHVKKCRNHLKG